MAVSRINAEAEAEQLEDVPSDEEGGDGGEEEEGGGGAEGAAEEPESGMSAV